VQNGSEPGNGGMDWESSNVAGCGDVIELPCTHFLSKVLNIFEDSSG
jgi:hypothetical protein